jgi:hypothetical protein
VIMPDLDKLERLHRMREGGILSDDEYQTEKAKALANDAISETVSGRRRGWATLGLLGSVLVVVCVIFFFTGAVLTTHDGHQSSTPTGNTSTVGSHAYDTPTGVSAGSQNSKSNSAPPVAAPAEVAPSSAGLKTLWRSANFLVQTNPVDMRCQFVISSEDGNNRIILSKKKAEAIRFATTLDANVPEGTTVPLILDVATEDKQGDDTIRMSGQASNGTIGGFANHDLIEAIGGGDWASGVMDYDGDRTATASASYRFLGSDAALKKLYACSDSY